MGATYVGVRRAHPYSWLLSSPQQPLETEDPPTVSLAPQYTSQRLCRASGFLASGTEPNVCCVKAIKHWILHAYISKILCRFFSDPRVEISSAAVFTPRFPVAARRQFSARKLQYQPGSALRSSHARGVRYRSTARAADRFVPNAVPPSLLPH
jgi:hypothetical protein